MKALEYGMALYKIARYEMLEKLRTKPIEFEKAVDDLSSAIRKQGFVVVEDYYTNEKCDVIIKEIDQLHETYKKEIFVDKTSADKRMFGANLHSKAIAEFWEDPFLNKIRDYYYQTTGFVGCTLAARIDAVADNIGSGGGWHRDTVYGTQLKAILYLSDVSEEQGPFQYLSYTHDYSSKLDAIKHCGIRFDQNRLDGKIVNKLLEKEPYELVTFTAKRGTLLLVDTTGIHRGKPLSDKCRYALTNYWFVKKMPPHIEALIIK